MEADLLKAFNGEILTRRPTSNRQNKEANIKRIIETYKTVLIEECLLGLANNMGETKILKK